MRERLSRPLLVLTLFGAACAHEAAAGRKWVHKLSFAGVHQIDEGELRDVLATEPTGWWPFASKKWLDQAALDLDLERIKAFYADRGFFDARIAAHEVRDRGNGSVDLRVTIDEGQPTRLERVDIAGLERLTDPRAAGKLGRDLPSREGQIYDYDKFMASKQTLALRLKEAGYAYAKVSGQAKIDRDQHAGMLEVRVDPGPLVHYGDTRVEGNGAIPAHVLLNRVTWEHGDTFSPHDLGTTQGRLYDLGVFSSVQVQLDPNPQAQPDVLVRVAPGPLHQLQLGGGVGVQNEREEVRLRARWRIANFLGGLRTLELKLKPAYVVIPTVFDPRRQGVAAENDLTLKQPDLFQTRITGHALAGYDLGISDGYQYYGPRLQLGIDRPFLRGHVLGGVSWNLQYLNFFDIDTSVFNPATTPLGFGFKNPYRLAYLEEFAQLDLRDQPLDPRSGAFVGVRVEEGDGALGGDFTYLKLTSEVRGYVPLGGRMALAGRGLVGWLNPAGELESPVTRRFALGGPSSHRGFSFGRLAPQVFDPKNMRWVPIGGDGEMLLSFESRIKVSRLYGYWLRLVPFVDGGDVTPKLEQLDPSQLHWAVGASLEYETPIGVARVGAGWRLNRTDLMGPNGLPNPDPGSRLSLFFTIGEAF